MAQAFNKIGFHVGPGGNATGLGEWMRKLDEAKIPFCLKSADSYGPLFEGSQLSRAAHVLVYRMSTQGQGDGFDYDVPDYNVTPAEAAAKHWQRMLAKLPPEFDKTRVWLEPINEVDKGRSDWLGNFAWEIAQLALADGYKVALFGWSSGEPEPADWETPGMLRYLQLCAEQPDRVAISLHEYSYKTEDIWFMRDFQVGRFKQLFSICDRRQIKRPNVIMTEWGWTYDNVPDRSKALQDIDAVAELYAQYPEVLGAAIWYLGPGFQGIANRAQKLIQPVTEFALQRRYEVVAAPPVEDEEEEPGGIILPAVEEEEQPGTNNARFIADMTIPDNTRIQAGSPFTKTWRVENSGDKAWGAGYQLVHVAGEPMTNQVTLPLPAAQPGQQVDISLNLTAPGQPGNYFGDWRCQDDKGNLFGDIVFLKIVVTPAPVNVGVNNSRFVADVTIPDDSVIQANQAFLKTWRAQNNGTRVWGAGYQLVFLRGTPMTNLTSIPLPAARPGEQVDISVNLTAPPRPGTYWCDWRMQDVEGNFFGELLFTRINVPQPEGSSGIRPLGQCDPRWGNERLGNSLSNKTICQWGCLLTVFTMVANAYGNDLTPPQLNTRIVRGPGFINNNLTPWKVLSDLFGDIIYEGKRDTSSTPDILERVNAAVDRGELVALQVDNTPNTPYVADDQHWVLVIGRGDGDYRVNDPLSGQEVSLQAVYGRPGRPLRDAVLAAIFHRSTKMKAPLIGGQPGGDGAAPVSRLQTGMNVNPDAPNSNPYEDDTFKGLDWARFVFKAAAKNRSVQAAFGQYDPIVKAYADEGVGSLMILNQETVWGNSPWKDNGDWNSYADQLAAAAGEIAGHYSNYGDKVAYEIWNEGDLANNPSSVFAPPAQFAPVLQKTATAIRQVAPQARLIFGGLASGPESAIAYVRDVKAALGGNLPVDAIGIHPYGRWATRAPFDWGQRFGTLGDAFRQFEATFPQHPLWITEIGVAVDNPLGAQFHPAIADYMKDIYQHVGERYVQRVPVVIWFAWSDNMRNAGVVDGAGNRKTPIYNVFRAIRNGELDQFGL
ncbi:MAG: cellulase family glycosylhydrolase [Chloroflexi bacterium]|nr:cellulase family glycosylhydrolase [Chloroflexota bacterium]MCI0578979.1 cellulase family glycosylhydrolase [Chloroflexota bacterium]MCI0644630.1 cellulase family glycosylhydrolase [Chloroflexota bacterium]MCI0730457.1 cellulase family glycosylhydrolase [Chloroflexota bacterium]